MTKKMLIVAMIVSASTAFAANDAFTKLDTDHSGAISKAEAVEMPGLMENWATLDTDENNELSREEFGHYSMKK